jgi:uncharacterized RDD family membrane protein YckC
VIDRSLILTPEKAVLMFQPAGLGSRVIAGIIDVLAILALFTGLSYVQNLLIFVLPEFLQEHAVAFFVVLLTFVLFLYFWVQEYFFQGRTLGKLATGLRVVMLDGTPITSGAAFLRSILILADYFPFFIVGLTAIFTNERAQRLGDLAAGTMVVRQPALRLRVLPSPHQAGVHPFEGVIGDLGRMTMEEYAALKRLVDRFPSLPPNVQIKTLEDIWKPFAEREKIITPTGVHPLLVMEAVVMKYGRGKKLL